MARQPGLFDPRGQERVESESAAIVPIVEDHACDSGQPVDSGIRETAGCRFTDAEIGRVADAIVKLEKLRSERMAQKEQARVNAMRGRPAYHIDKPLKEKNDHTQTSGEPE